MRENLRLFREGIGFTQEQMASKLGYARGYYCAVEQGVKNGSINFWRDLQIKFQIKDNDMWVLTKTTNK